MIAKPGYYQLRFLAGATFKRVVTIRGYDLTDWTGNAQVRRRPEDSEVLVEIPVDVTVQGEDTVVTLGPIAAEETSTFDWDPGVWALELVSPDETETDRWLEGPVRVSPEVVREAS